MPNFMQATIRDDFFCLPPPPKINAVEAEFSMQPGMPAYHKKYKRNQGTPRYQFTLSKMYTK
jgi:hypothetical protein